MNTITTEYLESMISEMTQNIIDGDHKISEQQKSDIVKNLSEYLKHDAYELLSCIARGGSIDCLLMEYARAQFKAAVMPVAKEIVMDIIQ